MRNADWEALEQRRADEIDMAIIADPSVPPGVRASVRRDLARRREHTALMGSREYRDAPWTPPQRPAPAPRRDPGDDLVDRYMKLARLAASPAEREARALLGRLTGGN